MSLNSREDGWIDRAYVLEWLLEEQRWQKWTLVEENARHRLYLQEIDTESAAFDNDHSGEINNF